MDKILTHGFEREFNERIEKRHDIEKQAIMAVIERRAQKSGHTKASLIRAEYQQTNQRKLGSSLAEPSANLYQRGKSLNSAKAMGNLPPVLKNNQYIDEAIKKILNQNNMT